MTTTLLYDDFLFLQHDTGKHVESAQRLERVQHTLSTDSELASHILRVPRWEEAGSDAIQRVHALSYLQHLAKFAAAGGGQIEQDTILSPRSL